MRSILIAVLVFAVLAIGGGAIATTAYQAGLAADVTVVQSGATGVDGTVTAPVVVPAYGYGWGWGPGHAGFGFFGLLAALFFIVLLIGFIRVVAFRGGGGWGGRGGWGGPRGGWGGPRGGWGGAHEVFDEWHRSAHEGSTPTPPAT
jgi:hypothetical protein